MVNLEIKIIDYFIDEYSTGISFIEIFFVHLFIVLPLLIIAIILNHLHLIHNHLHLLRSFLLKMGG